MGVLLFQAHTLRLSCTVRLHVDFVIARSRFHYPDQSNTIIFEGHEHQLVSRQQTCYLQQQERLLAVQTDLIRTTHNSS